ncbi:hypothetical protein PINS_up000113 [Pythium insidiosum]|nr:hypothetical protein PINS_up000113 [Pythium insidiosum]
MTATATRKRRASPPSRRRSQRLKQRDADSGQASAEVQSVTGVSGIANEPKPTPGDSLFPAQPATWGSLCDAVEQRIIAFLSYLPDRLVAELVCRRWYRLSREEVPMHVIDFSSVDVRNARKRDIGELLKRTKGKLVRLVLPDMRMEDAILRHILEQSQMRFFRAHRLSLNQVNAITTTCLKLEVLWLMFVLAGETIVVTIF